MARSTLIGPLGALLLTLGATAPAVDAQLNILRQGPDSDGFAEEGDLFGRAITSGDFDGDGYDDVAIGAPGDVFGGGPGARGSVTVQYGSKHGITWKDALEFRPDHTWVPLTDKAWFGQALAAGDFDDDGYDDLAVGAPFAEVNGQNEAGFVVVYPGSANGLTGFGSQVFDQGDLGILVEDFDRFGWSLAAGPLGGDDEVDDLLIGSPGENDFTGLVAVLKGTPGVGLTANGSEWYTPQSIGAAVNTGGRFGYSVAIGNVTGFAATDALVGAPFNDVGGVSNSGSAHVILGSGSGLTAFLAMQFDATDAGEPLDVEGRFGWSVVTGAFSGDHQLLDLAIGSPGADGFDGFVAVTDENDGNIVLDRKVYPSVVTAVSTHSDEYGTALASGDFDADGHDELAIGAPGMQSGGEVHVVYGTPSGLGFSGERFEYRDMGEASQNGAGFAEALCFGDFDLNARQSVVAGVPDLDNATGQAFDIAPWRQTYGLTCNTALVANCAGEILFAMKPHERVMIASTTKIMTALLGCEAVDRPQNDPLQVDLTDVYTVQPWMGVGYPPGTLCSVFGLVPGEQIRFEDLLRTCIMRSGNDSSFAIADMMTNEVQQWNGTVGTTPQFVQLMNDRATQLGMVNTLFTNPPGVDPGDPYSSAYDMWLLTREAMKNPLFADICGTADYGFVRNLPNGFQPVNVSFGTLKSAQAAVPTAMGVKGGSTPGAQRTVVLAARQPQAPFGTVYGLGFGWATSAERVAQGNQLLQFGLEFCYPGLTLPPLQPPEPPFVPDQILSNGFSASLNDVITPYDWGSDIDLEIQSLATRGTPAGTGLLSARHDASIQLEPGASATTSLLGIGAVDGGVILNQSGSAMAFLTLRTVVDGNGSTQTVVLAPGQPFDLSLGGPTFAGSFFDVDYVITNDGTSTAHLGLEHLFSKSVLVGDGLTVPAIDGATLSRDYEASTEGIELILDGTGSSGHPVALVMADAASGFVFDPCVARWNESGTGWPGTDGNVPALFMDADPALGTTPNVLVSPATTDGTETLFVFMGFSTLVAPSNKGGTLLVSPDIQLVLPNVPSAGLTVPLSVPNDPALCGVQLHAQLIHTDAQASHGYAFSRGLTMTFGHLDVAPQ